MNIFVNILRLWET